jgi:hypothetical protein
MLVLPAAGNPADVLEPVKDAIHRRPGTLCCLHDGPAVQLAVIGERGPEEYLEDVEQRLGNTARGSHNPYHT